MRVCLATYPALPDLGEDDRRLLDELLHRGHQAVPWVWQLDCPMEPFPDVVVVRSTWDYYTQRERFLAWAGDCARRASLFNDLPTLRWNSDKSYLQRFARQGLPIVPTEFVEGRSSTLREIQRRRGWSDVVVKPRVSAGAFETHLIRDREVGEFEARFRELVATRPMLVQPYIPAVEAEAERSLVYLEGTFSHSFDKGHALPVDRRESAGYHGVEATGEERELGRRVMAEVGPGTVYARIDLLPDGAGGRYVGEAELVEPYLHLQARPDAAARLADALERRATR